ncbi:MAG: S8 family serine peptidase [Acidobacteria bacterium]|nr:S8 family serine peptidase [Acidobacteriota bacterium]
MKRLPSRSLPVSGLCLFLGLSFVFLQPQVADAQQRRAKLSKGLEEGLRGSERLRVLVEGPQDEVDRIASRYGVRVLKRLEMGALVSGTGAQLGAVAGDGNVSALTADDVVTSTMSVTTQATGANQLWAGRSGGNFSGLTGAGVGVAVVDSGIAQHPDVENRVRLRVDFVNDGSGEADGYGHGTHVAGIIAGGGKGSRGDEGTAYIGMAPGAELVSLRVLAADGTGYVSDVILAIEWAIKHKDRYKLRVLNLSLGHEATQAYDVDPLARAVERAVAAGLIVVASAGNLGKSADGTAVVGMVVSPGDTPGAITVGALNTHATVGRADDTVATYSSRGPVGDPEDPSSWRIKPDLVAPGNAVVAAGAYGSHLWNLLPERQVIGASGGTYLTLSGSSMATAVVTGAVAQVLQARPDLTPAQAKFVLQVTAEQLPNAGLIEQGAGSLNVVLAAALASGGDLSTMPTSVVIGGGPVAAGGLAFFDKTVSATLARADITMLGNTALWHGAVGGDAIIWGHQSAAVDSNAIIWGHRTAAVDPNAIIWGHRSTAVDPNAIIWGHRSTAVDPNAIIWGHRSVAVDPNAIIWGHRSAAVDSNAIIWGHRSAAVDPNAIIWGHRSTAVDPNAIIWGHRTAAVDPNAIIWGHRSAAVDPNAIIWGHRSTAVDPNAIIWGHRTAAVDPNAIIWGHRAGVLDANTVISGQ